GDLWEYGAHRFHEESAQAIGEETGYAAETVYAAGRVSRAFQPCTRVQGCSFSHYREVAALEAEQAQQWLENAVAGKWSHKELHGRLKAAGLVGALDVHFSSDSSEWYTPAEVIERVV